MTMLHQSLLSQMTTLLSKLRVERMEARDESSGRRQPPLSDLPLCQGALERNGLSELALSLDELVAASQLVVLLPLWSLRSPLNVSIVRKSKKRTLRLSLTDRAGSGL